MTEMHSITDSSLQVAKDIAKRNKEYYDEGGSRCKDSEQECLDSASEMAEWEEQRIREVIVKLDTMIEDYEKQDGRKLTCAASRLRTPEERSERHGGFISGLITAKQMVEQLLK